MDPCLLDVLHELLARQLRLLHLLELEFPVAGQFGRAQLVDAEAGQRHHGLELDGGLRIVADALGERFHHLGHILVRDFEHSQRPDGADPRAGVTVEASSPALIEKVRTVFTDAQGLYRLVDLRPGTYKVTFTLPGFATFVRDGLTLEGAAAVTVNGQMKVGALEETLTVTGEAPIVDVSSTAKEQVVTRELLDAIPTGRQVWTVAVTMPGVTLSGQDVGGAGGLQQTRMRAFGTVEQEVTMEIDSILMNSVHGGGSTQQYFNDGMVQEMSVQTGALSAEVQTGGVRINMIPQTGSNQLHGSFVAISVPNSSAPVLSLSCLMICTRWPATSSSQSLSCRFG